MKKTDARAIITVLLGSTILMALTQPSQAANDGRQSFTFREYRNQNSGLDRHLARQMFKVDRQGDRRGDSVAAIAATHASRAAVLSSRRIERMDPQFTSSIFSSVRNQSLQVNDSGRLLKLNRGVDLDLTSSAKNIVLGKNIFSNGAESIQITIGGETRTLAAGASVTAAEYVAVKQVLSGAGQTVSVNRAGVATAGSIDLGALTQDNDVMRASNLVVASNVTTFGDFGKHSDFRLMGDLTNFGTINASSSDNRVRGGAIRAGDITNHAGASINSSVDLTVDASGNLINDGTIASTQALSLVAGSSISNNGTIRSTGNVNLQSSAISNSGLVSSRAGDINLDAPASTPLSFHNLHGTMSALNGAINLRNTAYSGNSNSTITGGDLLSREFNLNSGQGISTVDVNRLTGQVNETGREAHVSASTAVLNIGNVCLTGDPTFYNQGNINITGDVKVAENLVVVAAGNIITNDNVTIQAGDGNQGYNISLIAGAEFTPSGTTNNSPTLPGGTAGGVSLSGKSSRSGGGIQFGNNTFISAQSTDSVGADSGGNLQLVAFAGRGDLSGKVLIASSTVKTGGVNGGDNGDISIIAGSRARSTVVDAGVLDTTGGSGLAGDITVTAAAPIAAVRNQPIIFDANGNLVSGALVSSDRLNRMAGIHIAEQGLEAESKSSGKTSLIGGTINLDGQMEALNSDILLQSIGYISSSGTGSIKAMTIDLEAGGDIGSSTGNIKLDTPSLMLNNAPGSKGTNIYINETGVGGLTKIKSASQAAHLLSIIAPNEDIELDNIISFILIADAHRINGGIFSRFGDLGQIPLLDLTLKTNDPTFDLNGINFSNVKNAHIDVAGNFGMTGSTNALDHLKSIDVKAGGGISVDSKDRKTALNLSAKNNVVVTTIGGVIDGAASTMGSVSVAASSGTLKIAGNVSSATGAVFQNAGAKSNDKIEFTSDSNVIAPTIDVLIGPSDITPAPAPANVLLQPTAGGIITLTGSGVRARRPLNTITATGAGHYVNLNNGLRNRSVTFGGGVQLTAN